MYNTYVVVTAPEWSDLGLASQGGADAVLKLLLKCNNKHNNNTKSFYQQRIKHIAVKYDIQILQYCIIVCMIYFFNRIGCGQQDS